MDSGEKLCVNPLNYDDRMTVSVATVHSLEMVLGGKKMFESNLWKIGFIKIVMKKMRI